MNKLLFSFLAVSIIGTVATCLIIFHFASIQEVKHEHCVHLGGVLAKTTSGWQCVQPIKEAA